MLPAAFAEFFLSLYSKCRMRNKTKPLLRYELSCHAADAVSLVFDTDKSRLKILDKLILDRKSVV